MSLADAPTIVLPADALTVRVGRPPSQIRSLGYKYSVFNLVYVNNIASVKIWDSLGFTRAGLVPKAGRLRKVPGAGPEQDSEEEEYVDAILFWRDFATPVPARQT